MVERVAALHPGRPDVARACAGLLRAAASRCDPAALTYVEVSEEDNPRLSCDVNLYPADLALAELEPLLVDAANCFGISAATLAGRVPGLRRAALGHLSTGTGRDGAPFLTIYYALPGPDEA